MMVNIWFMRLPVSAEAKVAIETRALVTVETILEPLLYL